jgi:hypothetical protein
MEEIRILLRRLADTASAAQAHYQIWFTLRGDGKALPTYYQDMNDYRYVDFFHAGNAGHYKLMFLELGCRFDSDSRAASFRNLKNALTAKGHIEIVTRIDSVLQPFNDLVSNALTIRSRLIAHRELSATSEVVHQENPVIPNDVGKLLRKCCALINEIDTQLFGDTGCRIATTTDRFERATFELLEVIRNGRS